MLLDDVSSLLRDGLPGDTAYYNFTEGDPILVDYVTWVKMYHLATKLRLWPFGMNRAAFQNLRDQVCTPYKKKEKEVDLVDLILEGKE